MLAELLGHLRLQVGLHEEAEALIIDGLWEHRELWVEAANGAGSALHNGACTPAFAALCPAQQWAGRYQDWDMLGEEKGSQRAEEG